MRTQPCRLSTTASWDRRKKDIAYSGSLRPSKKSMLEHLTGWNRENCIPVEAGNSPFTNPEQIIHEDGTPFDFIEWHRSARWVTVTETPAVEVSDKERFDFYTDRKMEQGSLEETRKFLRDAQSFLGCEILALMGFLKEKGLLYEYLRYKYKAHACQIEEEELPFS